MALYGRTRRWAMTERGAGALERSAQHLRIGPSALRWDGDTLHIRIDERTLPIPRRLQGEVRVRPRALTRRSFALDEAGLHRWTPIAPESRVEVDLVSPALRWAGTGYLDSNEGDRALEQDFLEWDWCRAPLSEGTAILYESVRKTGGDALLALRVDRSGSIERFDAPPKHTLPPTLWRLRRTVRSEQPPRARQSLEDAPFYARSVVETQLLGEPTTAMHETLSLERFRSPIVQAMLPFRIPRRP